MEKYDVDELYKKESLTVNEACYLLGDIPNQNVYEKLGNGRLKYRLEKGENGLYVKKILTKSLYDYILSARGEIYRRAERYKLPSVVPDNLKD